MNLLNRNSKFNNLKTKNERYNFSRNLACTLRSRLGDVAVFENRQPVTAAKFITKSTLFILLLGFIRRLEMKLIS